LENALESTFDNASNMHSWSEVGIVPITKKCLTNKKVCHDGTDKDNPNFDIYQDIQSQNDFSTAQLSVMGYKGDALKAQFREDKIRERQATGHRDGHGTPDSRAPRGYCRRKYAWQEVFCHRRQACHLRLHVQSGGDQ
jgi:hypothetical protein